MWFFKERKDESERELSKLLGIGIVFEEAIKILQEKRNLPLEFFSTLSFEKLERIRNSNAESSFLHKTAIIEMSKKEQILSFWKGWYIKYCLYYYDYNYFPPTDMVRRKIIQGLRDDMNDYVLAYMEMTKTFIISYEKEYKNSNPGEVNKLRQFCLRWIKSQTLPDDYVLFLEKEEELEKFSIPERMPFEDASFVKNELTELWRGNYRNR